jgi:hypothetical protein
MLINQENFYQNVVKAQLLNALHLSGNEGNTYINCICSNQKSEGSKDFSINRSMRESSV